MRLIGLDIGTTGCKAALFDEEGALLASASREYPILMPHPGWAEQDAEQVWRLAQDVIRQVVAQVGGEDVGCTALSTHREILEKVRPVQHRSPVDVRAARHTRPIEHGAARSPRLRGFRRRQA